MKKLTKEEMLKVEGGADPVLITVVVSSLITFITGVLHGYANPKKCNN